MPNNELPNLNNGENQSSNNQMNNQPGGITPPGGGIHYEKIEIPQEYYNKLDQEKHEKEMQEQQAIINDQESREANKRLAGIGIASIFNGVVTLALLHTAFEMKDIALFAIPIVFIIGTIFSSLKSKKESTYHTSVLVGGMFAAVVSYVLCLTKEETSEYWMHYAIGCAISGFVGFLVCSIIHNVITNRENIKAVGYVGIVLFFAALIGVPYYFYQKNPEEIYRQIFMKTTEVKAETEFEFITKTLKNRYNIDFQCQSTKYKTDVQKGRKISQRTCNPTNDLEKEITVFSLAYNEGENQYIVTENYLDILKFNDFRTTHATAILNNVSATKVNFYMYPKENCSFIGDCAECDEYYENYENEIDVDKRYAASSKVDYSKYLNMDAKNILNDGEFKYVINIVGAYTDLTDTSKIVDNVLTYLNNQGLKNKYGYQISIYKSENNNGETEKLIYKVKGEASGDQTFKDPKVVDSNANKNNN